MGKVDPDVRRERLRTTRGKRAEDVVSWYFRLNGFLSTAGFVIHDDEPGGQITEADLLGVRFSHTVESLMGIKMTDDRWMQQLCDHDQILFVIVEVKASHCSVNRKWTERSHGAMERTIRRLGFAAPEEVKAIAVSMYDRLRWKCDRYILQFVSVGSSRNHEARKRYPDLVQLTWDDIAAFLWERFSAFGRVKGAPGQWPRFGRAYARAVLRGQINCLRDSAAGVGQYIEEGCIGQ